MKVPKEPSLPVESMPSEPQASRDPPLPRATPDASASRLHARLVCADASLTRLVQERLAALGVLVSVQPPADQDAAGVQAASPDLAVVDVPGAAVALRKICGALRAGPGGTDVLILGLLSDASARAQCDALAAGCDEVLAKPPDPSLLGLRLALMLRRAGERRALRQAGRGATERASAAGEEPAAPALAESLQHAFLAGSMDAVYVLRAVADPSGVFTDFVIADVNERGERAIALGRTALLGKRVSEFGPHIWSSDLKVRCLQALSTGQPIEGERSYPAGTASPSWYRFQVVPYAEGVILLSRNITKRKRTEEDLRQSRALLQAIFDTIPHDIFVKDRSSRYLMVNRSMARRWERTPEDFAGKSKPVDLPAEEAGERESTDRQVMERGESVSGTFKRTFPSGAVRSLHIIKTPLRDGRGDIVGLVGMGEDVTERIQAETDLRHSRALLQAVFDAIPHAVFVKDREDRYVTVNKATEALQPPEAGALIGQRLLGAGGRPRPEQELSARSTRQVVEGAGRVDFDQVVTLGDREPRVFHIVKVPLRNGNGEVAGVVGVAEDITEFTQAERKLRDSQALLQAVFDTIPHELVVKDREHRILMANRRTTERWNQPMEELLGQHSPGLRYRTEDDLRRAEASDLQVLKDGLPYFGVVERSLPGGERRPFEVAKAPLRDAQGGIVGLVAVAVDIAERVRAEAALLESRSLLQAILDALPESVYVKDRAGRYTLLNEEAVRRLERPRDRLIGQTLHSQSGFTRDTMDRLLEADRKVLEAGEIVELPQELRQYADGRVRWERRLKAPLRDAGGAIVGIVGIAEDITGRVRAEQALKASELLLHTIIDSLPEALFVKDREGRYRLVNARQAALYGFNPRDFLGHTSAELYARSDPKLMETIAAADKQVLESGQTVEIPEISRKLPSGEELWERIVKAPLRNDTGEVIGLIGIREDITARKEAEDERLGLERLMQRTQNLESLGAMAGGIAHDFNNLLQRILGYAELALLEAGPDSPAQESLQLIHAAGAAAVALTRQMLTLSGRSGFALEPVDLNHLAHTTALEMEKLIAAPLTLSIRPGPDAPMVMADMPLLRQVLLSLVSNAAEALADSAAGEITVTTGTQLLAREALDETYSDRDLQSGLYGYLEVRDTGPGLPEGIRRRLYEPFHSTKFIGRGLGLAAVRGIVRGHQGTIQALSVPNAGATFRVFLPAAGNSVIEAAATSAPA